MLQISLELNEHSAPRRDSFEIPKGLELQKRVVMGWRSWYFEARAAPNDGLGFSGLRNYTGQQPASCRRAGSSPELIRPCDNVRRRPALLFFFSVRRTPPFARWLPFFCSPLFPFLSYSFHSRSLQLAVPIRPQISLIGRAYRFCSASVSGGSYAFG